MIDKRYIAIFQTGRSMSSVEVYAACEEAALILAQAVMIKDGKDWRKLFELREAK